jgi:hypothetical protein
LAIVATRSSTLEGQGLGQQMSALGQKQTFAPQNAMSALPPKADNKSAPHIASIATINATMMTL